MSQIEKLEKPMFEAGYYSDMSNEDYHGSHGISSSALKLATSNTQSHIWYAQNNPIQPTESIRLGTIVHSLLLEPDSFEDEYIVMPKGLSKPSIRILNAKKPSAESVRQIQAWMQWQEEAGDKEQITEEQHKIALIMRDKALNHPIVKDWFDKCMGGLAEQTVFYWYKPEHIDTENEIKMMCKVRPDWILPGHDVIFDLKTSLCAGFTKFMKQCHKLMYHMSAAMYLEGCNSNKEFLDKCGVWQFNKFVWVVIENLPPYECTYYECSVEDLLRGKSLYHSLVRRLHKFQESEWKGYGETNELGLIGPEGRVSQIPDYGYDIA